MIVFPIRFGWVLVGIALCGCRISEDVSADERYRPSEVLGHCYELPQGGYLVKADAGEKHDFYEPPGDWFPPLAEFKSGTWDKGRYTEPYPNDRVRIVEPATKVRVISVVHVSWPTDSANRPLGEIIGGPLAGKKLYLDSVLLDPYGGKVGHWKAVGEFLSPCGLTGTSSRPAE